MSTNIVRNLQARQDLLFYLAKMELECATLTIL